MTRSAELSGPSIIPQCSHALAHPEPPRVGTAAGGEAVTPTGEVAAATDEATGDGAGAGLPAAVIRRES